MVSQTQRVTRARAQLEQMGRTNCFPREPSRIPSTELQSLAAIERTRLGGALPGPERPVPTNIRDLPQPSTGLWLVHTPQPAADGEAQHPGDDSPDVAGDDSDSMSLLQTARHQHGGGFSPTVAQTRSLRTRVSPSAEKTNAHGHSNFCTVLVPRTCRGEPDDDPAFARLMGIRARLLPYAAAWAPGEDHWEPYLAWMDDCVPHVLAHLHQMEFDPLFPDATPGLNDALRRCMAVDLCEDIWSRAAPDRRRIHSALQALQGTQQYATRYLGYFLEHHCARAQLVGPEAFTEPLPAYLPRAQALLPNGLPPPSHDILAHLTTAIPLHIPDLQPLVEAQLATTQPQSTDLQPPNGTVPGNPPNQADDNLSFVSDSDSADCPAQGVPADNYSYDRENHTDGDQPNGTEPTAQPQDTANHPTRRRAPKQLNKTTYIEVERAIQRRERPPAQAKPPPALPLTDALSLIHI